MKSILNFLVFIFSVMAMGERPYNATHADIHALTGREKHVHLRGEGAIGKCRERKKLSVQDIAKKLQDFNLVVLAPKEEHKDILIYLWAYFETLEIKPSVPLTVLISQTAGPRLARKADNTLILTKNAAHEVFPTKLNKVVQENENETSLNVDFKNTFFEQLTAEIADINIIEAILQKQFGISIHPDVQFEDSKNTREMTVPEAVMVLKQFLDLPMVLTDSMKIKSVNRMRSGVKNKDVAADYRLSDQSIRLYDLAFQDGPKNGEGTVVHELGHALWPAISMDNQERFKNLSWQQANNFGQWRIIPGKDNFVSEYSMKNSEEDFAETFSTFVNNPEWLKTKTPEKHFYLKELFNNYFADDSEYSTNGDGKTKVLIKSDNPDTKPPYFKGKDSISKNIQLAARVIKDKGQVEISCTVSNVFDDISGVNYIALKLQGLSKNNQEINLPFDCTHFSLRPEHCINKNTGIYNRTWLLYLSDFPSETTLRLKNVNLEDMAKNWSKTLNVDRQIDVLIPGTRPKLIERPKVHELKEMLDKISIQELPIEPGKEPSYLVTLPLGSQLDFNYLRINWSLSKDPSNPWIHHTVHATDSSVSVDTKNKTVSFTVYFPKYFKSQIASISGVYIDYDSSQTHEKQIYSINTDKRLGNLDVPIKPTAPSNIGDTLELDVNAMKNPTSNNSKANPDQPSVDIKIPVNTNLASLDLDGMVYLTSPSGKRIQLYDATPKFIIDDIGKMWIHYNLNLPTNPEAGDYIIESIKLSAIPTSQDIGMGVEKSVKPSYFDLFDKTVKLSERGIKRSFNISR